MIVANAHAQQSQCNNTKQKKQRKNKKKTTTKLEALQQQRNKEKKVTVWWQSEISLKMHYVDTPHRQACAATCVYTYPYRCGYVAWCVTAICNKYLKTNKKCRIWENAHA